MTILATELRQFAGDINLEDLQTREALLEDAVTGEIGMDDNVDGWVDEMVAQCTVTGRTGSTARFPSACQDALSQGRYCN